MLMALFLFGILIAFFVFLWRQKRIEDRTGYSAVLGEDSVTTCYDINEYVRLLEKKRRAQS